MSKIFNKADQVILNRASMGVTETDREVIIPRGTQGRVIEVRPHSCPDGVQGAWLYEVEVLSNSEPVLLIYDATDVHHIERVQ